MLNFVLCDDNELILTKMSKMLESIFIKNNLSARDCIFFNKSWRNIKLCHEKWGTCIAFRYWIKI